jgi:hypothetical protein
VSEGEEAEAEEDGGSYDDVLHDTESEERSTSSDSEGDKDDDGAGYAPRSAPWTRPGTARVAH